MKLYDTHAAAASAVAARPERPATLLMHEAPGARLVIFRIAPGQSVPSHTNASTVVLTVLQGAGFVAGTDGERPVSAGDVVAYEPDEPHAMRSGDTELVLIATIAPSPASR